MDPSTEPTDGTTWRIEHELPNSLARFVSPEEAANVLAYEILDQLEVYWEQGRLPDHAELEALLGRLDERATDGHRPTMQERAAATVMQVADDLDRLAATLEAERIGRADVPTWSTAFRSTVLGFGRRLPDQMYGALALELIDEAISTARDQYLIEGRTERTQAPIRSAMRIISEFPAPRPPSSNRLTLAALTFGHHELGEHEEAVACAERYRASGTGSGDTARAREAFELVVPCSIRSALALDRPDDALRFAEQGESEARRLFGEVPGWLQVGLLDATMHVDLARADRLAKDLLRSLQYRLPQTDPTVLRIAHRAIQCAIENGDEGLPELVTYWRDVAKSANDTPAAEDLLRALVVEDEGGNELDFEVLRGVVPDDPHGLR